MDAHISIKCTKIYIFKNVKIILKFYIRGPLNQYLRGKRKIKKNTGLSRETT